MMGTAYCIPMDGIRAALLPERHPSMPPTNDFAEALVQVAETLSVTVPDADGAPDWAAVRQYVTDEVAVLLDRNPAMLMHILYRVDVAEPKVKQVFAESPPTALATDLADLLIARQLEKVRLRRRYRTTSPPMADDE